MVTTGYLEHDVHVQDMKFHYQEWGNPSAPTILMLHGFGVSGHMFDEFAERMQDRYHLIALDQRGHGDTDWAPEGDYSRDAYVGDLEGFRETLGIGRFILVGHSMGGLISVGYTVRNPGVVRALVLVDVGPEASREGVENIQRFTRGPDELEFEEFVQMAHRFNQRRSLENIRERMRHRLKQTDSGKWTWKFDKRFREAPAELRIGSQLSNDDQWQMFRAVEAPTLLVRGAESDVLTPAVAERAVTEMRRARLVTVPAAGHSVPGDNPDDFTAAVTEFFGDLEMGRFEPASSSQPPPLNTRLEGDLRGRRGGGLGLLLLAGLGATVALGAAAFAAQRVASKRKQQTILARAEPVAHNAGRSIDLDHARRRALELASELSAVGQSGVSRARATLHEVDLERARSTARDLAHALGDSSAEVRQRVDNRRRRSRRDRRLNRVVVSGAITLASALLRSRKKKSRSRWLAWRS